MIKKKVLTISNLLSFIRAPLALVFLQKNIFLRLFCVFLAMISDSVDGYFARKNKSMSKFGAVLDPVMDKFFVYFVLSVLYLENNIHLLEALTLLSRDFALCIYGLYALVLRKWSLLKLRSIRWGKVTTAMQFLIIIGVTLNYKFSFYIYSIFILLGILSLVELLQKRAKHSQF